MNVEHQVGQRYLSTLFKQDPFRKQFYYLNTPGAPLWIQAPG